MEHSQESDDILELDAEAMVSSTTLLLLITFHLSLSDHSIMTDHPCIRTCEVSSTKVCEYDFRAEYFYIVIKVCRNCPHNIADCYRHGCIQADGNSRTVLFVNKKLSPPGIHVCEEDIVVVDVDNKMTGAGMSIHWILHHDTPHMDGVGMLTQCPIAAFTSFQYRFAGNHSGTHFWHGHPGRYHSDGIYGACFVRQVTEREFHQSIYDYDLSDHAIHLPDWLIKLTLDKANHHHTSRGVNPLSVLINGSFSSSV